MSFFLRQVAESKIVFLGGRTTGNEIVNDVYLFDAETKEFSQLPNMTAPRAAHVCEVVESDEK